MSARDPLWVVQGHGAGFDGEDELAVQELTLSLRCVHGERDWFLGDEAGSHERCSEGEKCPGVIPAVHEDWPLVE